MHKNILAFVLIFNLPTSFFNYMMLNRKIHTEITDKKKIYATLYYMKQVITVLKIVFVFYENNNQIPRS